MASHTKTYYVCTQFRVAFHYTMFRIHNHIIAMQLVKPLPAIARVTGSLTGSSKARKFPYWKWIGTSFYVCNRQLWMEHKVLCIVQ